MRTEHHYITPCITLNNTLQYIRLLYINLHYALLSSVLLCIATMQICNLHLGIT